MDHRHIRHALFLVCCVLAPASSAHAISCEATEQSIAAPKRTKYVAPEYPELAQKARIQGVVSIQATVGADGKVRNATVVKSVLHLDEAAIAAVKQWEFEPTLINGVAAPVTMTVQVAFSLSDPSAKVPAAPRTSGSSAASAPTPAPATIQQPRAAPGGVPPKAKPTAADREWEEKTAPAAAKLALDGKLREAVAMVQKFVARFSSVAAAHMTLADLYEELGGFGAPATAEQRAHLENAGRHHTLALQTLTPRDGEIVALPDIRFMLTAKLVRLYSADRLNNPAEAERYARRLVEEHPNRAEAHVLYGRLLHERGDLKAAVAVMRKGRALSDFPTAGLMLQIQYGIELVQQSPDLPPEQTRALLDEANAATDALLARPREDERDYRLATMAKSLAYELLAERVERDRQRRLALMLESERWSAPLEQHKNGAPPPPRKLTGADAANLEWEYLRRWYSRPADQGRLDESIASFESYLKTGAKAAAAHSEVAELSLRGAEEAKDETRRTAYREKAAVHLQRVVELETDTEARDRAFVRLIEAYGPAALNRPAQEEAAIRAMLKRTPTSPLAYARLVAVLVRTARSAEADKVLQAARAAIRATSSSRASMASELTHVVRAERSLAADTARRLMADAATLLSEAEKLNPNDVLVLEARGGWLFVTADRLETDAARANGLREQATRLLQRAGAIRDKMGKR